MQRPPGLLTIAFTLTAAASCNKNNNNPRPDRPAVAREDAGRPGPVVDEGPLTPPSEAIFVLRGAGIRKVLAIMAPGAPTRMALGQIAPGLSPGIGEHGVDVDPDAPFAGLAMPHTEGDRGRLQMLIAWPLRSGMEIAQQAQSLRGYREVMTGIYESTAPAEAGDAGAVAAQNPCWVARKQPVGWMLVCGPRELLRSSARYLVRAGTRAPDGDPVLDLDFRPAAARPILAAQIASLEAQDPRRSGVDAGAAIATALRAQYDTVHRTAMTYKEIADDLRSFHATLTLDENNYHLRAQADFANATASSTRAILASTVGRHGAVELLARLPAAVSSHVGMSLDGGALGPLLGSDSEDDDPRVAQAMGVEFVRFQRALHDLTGLRHAGERAIGFLSEEGGTRVEIMRMENAAAALQAVRAAAAAVPRTPRPSGMTPTDQFAVLPTPAGLPPGTLRIRLTPDPARLPPNAPAEMRQIYGRTTLLVPAGDTLTMIEARDPVARYNALPQGPRLHVEAPDDRAGVLHLRPLAALQLLGVPATDDVARAASGEAIDGTLSARRVGDAGAHFEVQVDAPIVSVNQVRTVLAQLQQQQQEAMEDAQRRARGAQGGPVRQPPGAARRVPGGPDPLLMPPASPDQLPEPNFQLRPPPQ